MQRNDDRGFTIIEVGVASFVLATVIAGVVGAMGAGMGLVGHSRQRSSGTGVAQERMERARNVAYPDLALNEDPTHSSDSTHPDFNVIENGPGPEDDQYRLADGRIEPLIINLADGGLKHLDDPFTLANTDFTVHQYVTWVDDPASGVAGAQDYKRVTVVVTWKFPVHSGPKHSVIESTYVSDGTVSLPSASPGATTTPAPTPTLPPVGGGGGSDQLGVGMLLGVLLGPLATPSGGSSPCNGDLTPPEMQSGELLSGSGTDQGYLNSTSVQLRFKARDPECHPITLYMANKSASNDCTSSAGYTEVQQLDGGGDPPAITVTWTIPAGDGLKSICAVIENKALQTSSVWAVNVKLDQTRPSTPASLTASSCNISGNTRNATFSWAPSSDANLYGYRLYRSIESAPFQLANQTTALSLSDSTPKNYSSVRYIVRAYDKAGNESLDSNLLSYSKNKC